MALFQTGTGYRDATKALTIKALQERQKAAAAATAAASEISTPMIDPLQGVQHLSGVLSGVMGQRSADQKEGEARQHLASIMAGIDPDKGPTQAQLAEMQTLDPDFANKQYETAMKQRYDTKERVAGQEFTSGLQEDTQAEGRTTAETLAKTNEAAAVSADTRSDENRQDEARIALEKSKADALLDEEEGKISLLLESGAISKEEAARRMQEVTDKRTADAQKAAGDAAAAGPSIGTPVTPEDAEKWGGDVKLHPGDYYIDEKTQRPMKISEYNAGAAAQRKDANTAKGDLATIDAGLNEMTRALELVDNILPGGSLGKGYADIAGRDPTGILGGPGTDATKRFYQIIEGSALKTMSAELKGSTALGELNRYISILADPNTSNEVKKQTIAAIMAKLKSGREIARQQLSDIGGGDPGEWTYANPDVLPGTTDTTQPAPAAVDDPAGIRTKKR